MSPSPFNRHYVSLIFRPSTAAGGSVTGSQYSISRAGAGSMCGSLAGAAGCAHESPPGTANCSLTPHNDRRDRATKFVCSFAQLLSLFAAGCEFDVSVPLFHI